MTGVAWPAIPGVESMTLTRAALWLCRWNVDQKIHEVGGNNRGPWPDYYASALGLDPAGAYPWCTSGMYCVFREAARQKRIVNPFPRTAKAVSVYDYADKVCRISNPVPGAVVVLAHGKAWAAELAAGARLTDNGHIAIVNETMTGDISGNTNAAGSREGNCWAEKLWPDGGDPAAVHGGVVLAYLNFDLAPTQPAT